MAIGTSLISMRVCAGRRCRPGTPAPGRRRRPSPRPRCCTRRCCRPWCHLGSPPPLVPASGGSGCWCRPSQCPWYFHRVVVPVVLPPVVLAPVVPPPLVVPVLGSAGAAGGRALRQREAAVHADAGGAFTVALAVAVGRAPAVVPLRVRTRGHAVVRRAPLAYFASAGRVGTIGVVGTGERRARQSESKPPPPSHPSPSESPSSSACFVPPQG